MSALSIFYAVLTGVPMATITSPRASDQPSSRRFPFGASGSVSNLCNASRGDVLIVTVDHSLFPVDEATEERDDFLTPEIDDCIRLIESTRMPNLDPSEGSDESEGSSHISSEGSESSDAKGPSSSEDGKGTVMTKCNTETNSEPRHGSEEILEEEIHENAE